MINLSIETTADSMNAIYTLKSGDRIDNLTLGMLVNNQMTGVVLISPVQVKEDRFFRYNITNTISMQDYLGDTVQKDKLLNVFLQIAETILESGKYMINPTSFMLDVDNVFLDKETEKLSLICIPLLSVVNDGNTCNFFKNVMFSSQFDLEENGDYVGKLITFLNPKTYTLEKFAQELREMTKVVDEEESIEKSLNENDIVVKSNSEDKLKDKVFESDKEEEKPKETEETIVTEMIDTQVLSEDVENAPFLIRTKTSQKIYILKDEFLIGSDEPNVDYCIAGNHEISDIHAKIVNRDNEYFIIDNNSDNRTYLNGVLVESEEENYIPHGVMIRFADEEYEFKMHE